MFARQLGALSPFLCLLGHYYNSKIGDFSAPKYEKKVIYSYCNTLQVCAIALHWLQIRFSGPLQTSHQNGTGQGFHQAAQFCEMWSWRRERRAIGKDETREGYERERAIWQKETYLPAQSGMITIWRDEAARVSQVPSKVQTEILEYNFHSI